MTPSDPTAHPLCQPCNGNGCRHCGGQGELGHGDTWGSDRGAYVALLGPDFWAGVL